MIAVALFALFALAASAPTSPTCDITKMTSCGNTFLGAIGATQKMSGVDFILFTQKLVYEKGVPGIQQICKSSQDLMSCLGDQAAACFNLADLQKAFQLSQEDSIVYTYQLVGMKYTCVDNPNPFVAQIQCIAKTSQDSYSQLSGCTNTFFSNMAKDPQNVCKYMEAYKTCTVPYYASCGADLQAALCKGMSVQANTVMPGCTWTCGSSFSSYLSLSDGTCDKATFVKCGTAFGTDLGLPQGPSPSGADFVKYIYNLVNTKGVAGIQQTCGATVNLNSCLGSMKTACFNVQSLVQDWGMTETDATEYIFQIQGMEYSCVANPAPFLAKIQCVADVSKASFNPLLQCVSTLSTAVGKNPAGACTALSAFKDCTVPYYASCGSDLQTALCNGIASQAKAVVPSCAVSC